MCSFLTGGLSLCVSRNITIFSYDLLPKEWPIFVLVPALTL